MPLPRLQLFELCDSPWAPVAVRETIIETLSRTLVWGRILKGLVAPFREFFEGTGAEEVLDLCSGAGGPVAILAKELSRTGARPPRFLLTDLQPHPEAWQRLREAYPGLVDFVPEPVDATRIEPALGGNRPRVIINSLHHFPPELAGAVLRGACADSPGVFVAEVFERNPLRFAPIAVWGLPALLANPVLSERKGFLKALLTWPLPLSALACAWDGLVSTLRVYTEEELRQMVAPLGDEFTWRYGTYPFAPFGRGAYFYGVRRRRAGSE